MQPDDISRRTFLKNLGAALSLLAADPLSGVKAAASTAAPAAASQAIPLKKTIDALWQISMQTGFLHTGVHNGAKKTLDKVDNIMGQYHRFWDSALHKGLANLNPEQAAAILVGDMVKKYPDLGMDERTYSTHIQFYSGILRQGIEHVGKNEAALLDDLMDRASDGYAHWCKLETQNIATRTKARAQFGDKAAPEPAAENSVIKEPDPSLPSVKDKDAESGDMESLLARNDVRIIQTGQGMHIASLNEKAIAQIGTLLHDTVPEKNLHRGTRHLTVDSPPHALLSLARPYIADYRHARDNHAQR